LVILSRLFSIECRPSTGGCQFLVQPEIDLATKSRDGRGVSNNLKLDEYFSSAAQLVARL